MTTVTQAREAIYQRFLDNYTGVVAGRITFENEEFEEPTSGEWVRLVVRSLVREQDTLGKSGNRRFRSKASVMVQVYALADSGVQQLDTLAEEAKDIYEGVSFSGLDFLAANINETELDGKWKQYVVDIEFDFDEIK